MGRRVRRIQARPDMNRLERSSEELTALLATISQAEAQPT
uniref:Uncharacterized protein n=1 Tax=Pseudomonas aeruginosa TaxID=287 RepID=A0A7S5YC92_PSEAI|nr:hypothetical protein [Pseudomonas aeruginosa]QNI17780.1 hypothetical protein [Pseudomonas aeruginosa]